MIDTPAFRGRLRSRVALIDWPALPSMSATTMLVILDQMEASQWWRSEELHRHQMAQLRHLLGHAVEQVPYYGSERMRQGGSQAEVSLEDWLQVPPLTRDEVQTEFDALQSRNPPDEHGQVSEVSTSGSTGHPVSVKTTRLSQMFAAVCGLRAHRWHRRDLDARLAAIYLDRTGRGKYPKGLQQPGWGWPAGEIYRTGPAALLSLNTPIPEQAEWLQRQQPSYLLSTPSNLLVLAEYCINERIELPELRDVATIMEVVTPELREACRKAWDVPVVDMYTTREAGCIAVQCPERDHYHVMAEDILVEILDETGRKCQPGEVGRVVVTPLHNFAMPLLRYDLGDYAEVGDACSCGRGLPVLKRIMGRVRNMLVLPDGRRTWPSFGRRKLVAAAPIKQYQIVQTELDTLELRLVMDRPLTIAEQESIRRTVTERMGLPLHLSFRYVDRIDHDAGGKFEEFRSEVG